MDGIRGMGRQANLVRRALGGDRNAARLLIGQAFDVYRDRALAIRGDLDELDREHWDTDAAREMAFAGEEVPPEQVLNAFSQIHTKLLFLSAAIPVVLMSDAEEADVFEQKAKEEAVDLLYLLHNPSIRYSIVAGFREEVREGVDDYLDRMGATLWGSVMALLSEDEITAADFPPETAAIMERMAEVAERQREA